MSDAFDGKVALVTGAGGGIGLATAEAFAEAGASVILVDRNEELIGVATDDLRSAGHDLCGMTCDVADASQVKATFEQTVKTYRRLPIVQR
ncbi:SDR family NAD(P)-dependent oxidoreductase [Paraburkholderia bryophila]|uniref:SDR family NAD(P)-dependent oxidoreductase n=1 Tax=Paraburkholderia bryophila TaxID=420952 RepID=UPI00234B0060|nr:SDR family NAD(P)-dependent oxidoreductase [Paraburkholderia bryophila]WCM21778.1 SDR family NAD(P)-dependent oxidoreductase [Paraburkholderia bryophila]